MNRWKKELTERGVKYLEGRDRDLMYLAMVADMVGAFGADRTLGRLTTDVKAMVDIVVADLDQKKKESFDE